MKKVTSTAELKNLISLLEFQQAQKAEVLKSQFLIVTDNLNPFNLIKKTLNGLLPYSDDKDNIWDTTFSYVAGFISQKVMPDAKHHPIKKLLSTLLETGIVNILTNNAEEIKYFTLHLLKTVLSKTSKEHR